MKKVNNLKIAVIGCGYWGTVIVLTLFKLGIKNIIVFDNYKENLKTIKKRFSKVFIKESLKDIINDKDISGVVICTPASTHFKIAKKFIEKGINLFIEKPSTLKSRDLKQLINLSKKKKKNINVWIYLYIQQSHTIYTKNNKFKKIRKNKIYIF